MKKITNLLSMVLLMLCMGLTSCDDILGQFDNPFGPLSISVKSIELDADEMTLTVGDVGQLIATVGPENATDKTVTWTSSNESVATVDATGKVTAVAEGTAKIKAKAGSISTTCIVTVKAATAAKTLAEATADDIGKIVGADGKIYATKADAEAVATGNAVAMIAYLGNGSDCTHGLAIQLNASPEKKNWNDAKTYASGLTAVPGGTWRLPSKADWQNMFVGCAKSGDAGAGNTMNPIAGFKEKIGATGITWKSSNYWSSTDSGSEAWYVSVYLSASKVFATFDDYDTSYNGFRVLGCLAF